MVKRREDLTTPRGARRLFTVHYDPEAFGNFSEGIARFLGTGRYLVWQTAAIIFWIGWNTFAPDSLQFDPYTRGLVLLTLVLSLQASYAAPLILLAQNRQEDRERRVGERDRRTTERTQANAEFLAREVASIRLALSDAVTASELEEKLEPLVRALDRLADRHEQRGPSGATPPPSAGPAGPR
jgi:uncharacterized membrane protein